MKKTEEYKKHAADCRALAKRMEAGEHQQQLIAMAETWETLARERERAASLVVDPPSNGPWMTGTVKS